jgi:hypothetical protein
MDTRCNIILYNPISGHGHLDGWLAMFAAILLRREYTVYCLTPDTEALLLRLRQRNLEQHPNIVILPLPDTSYYAPPEYYIHFLNRLRGLSNTYVNRLEGSRITPDMPFKQRSKKRLAQLLVPPAYAVFDAIRRFMQFLTPSAGVPQPIADGEAGHLSPDDWGRRMKKALQTLPSRRYFLFNMYMDMYRTDQSSWKEFALHCPLPWAGIRFVPAPVPCEAYYALPNLRGMCFLNEELCQVYSKALPGKHFACLPDVTDASLPPVPSPMAQVITERAVGRKVVLMGGSIGHQKNITQWRELIRQADPQRFFFAQIGEIHYGTFSEEEQSILRDLAAAPPENFFMVDAFLTDERDFNACINASDIIFAVYRDFRISSNMPGKAAAFDKPILVSDRYLMGERVRQYNLGAAVPEDNAMAILAALERLVRTPPSPENFAAYRAAHSEEAMGQALEKFLGACLQDKKSKV